MIRKYFLLIKPGNAFLKNHSEHKTMHFSKSNSSEQLTRAFNAYASEFEVSLTLRKLTSTLSNIKGSRHIYNSYMKIWKKTE